MADQQGVADRINAVVDQFISVLHVDDQRQGVRFLQPVPMNADSFSGRQLDVDFLIIEVNLVVPGMRFFVVV